MKKTKISLVLLLTTILFISCDKNKKLYQSGAENAIKEFVEANSFEAGTWQQGSFSVNSILSIEPVSQFTETEASTVVHFDFQDSYSNEKLVLKFKFQKDINKQWFLIGVEAVSGVGSQSVSDLIRKWSSVNVLVQNKNQDTNVKMASSENATVVGEISASASNTVTSAVSSNNTNINSYCGIWKYLNKSGSVEYIKIEKDKNGRYVFLKGYAYEGELIFNPCMLEEGSDIYLKPKNNKLVGSFASYNFYATHGELYNYKLTLQLNSNGQLLYSEYCSIRNGEQEDFVATKNNN
jgi:hypothetical protein